jgi:hypothetical protein
MEKSAEYWRSTIFHLPFAIQAGGCGMRLPVVAEAKAGVWKTDANRVD